MPDAGAFDFVLVGGGLQNGLIALALLAGKRARVALVEAEAKPGGNHLWCFHERDVGVEDDLVTAPLVVQSWPLHEVRFPNRRRVMNARYSAVTSDRLASVLASSFAARPDCRLACGVPARTVDAHRVVLANGEALDGQTVIDARGPKSVARGCGYQKFFGLELETTTPHDVAWPTLIDATVPQTDGFHFFYVLPLSPSRLLVEETWFSLSSRLDCASSRAAIARYVAERGFCIESEIRSESGVLPMPWQQDLARPERSPLVAGYAGGFFHPATGYSFPVALRLARHVASLAPEAPFGEALDRLFDAHVSQTRFMHALNRMLFCGQAPEEMWRIFERFYKLPCDVIERFYALELTNVDRARIVVGLPPRGFSFRRLFRSEVAA